MDRNYITGNFIIRVSIFTLFTNTSFNDTVKTSDRVSIALNEYETICKCPWYILIYCHGIYQQRLRKTMGKFSQASRWHISAHFIPSTYYNEDY